MTYTCEKCNVEFRDNCDLQRHISRKTLCVYECDVCKKKLKTQKSHRIHTNEKCKGPYEEIVIREIEKVEINIEEVDIEELSSDKYEHLYVISNADLSKKDEYKIGIWSGTYQALLSRYTTYLKHPIIYLFTPSNNTKKLEDIILNKYHIHRFESYKGKKLEWLKVPVKNLINDVVLANKDI